MLHKQRMKGVVVEKPGLVELKEDILIPAIGEYEVLCRNLAGALCTGTDLGIIYGKNREIRYPTILGHESVGRVVAAGCKVENYKIGDIVTSPRMMKANGRYSNWGGFCEYGIATDHKKMEADGYEGCLEMHYCNQVVPGEIGIENAVMAITWSEVCAYLDRIDLKQGNRVLLLGSGAVALSFAVMLNIGGCRVSVIGNGRCAERFKEAEAVEFVDYTDCRAMEVFRNENRSAFDCVVDAVGDRKTVENSLKMLRENGKLCLYGLKDGNIFDHFKVGEEKPFFIFDASYSVKTAYERVFEMIREKHLRADMWLDRIYALDDIHRAIDDLVSRNAIKVMLRFPAE